jgi:hypothetical protein
MLSQLDFKIFGLETIKEQYMNDADFKDVLQHCLEGRTWNKFILNDGFVFRANKLCIPKVHKVTRNRQKSEGRVSFWPFKF